MNIFILDKNTVRNAKAHCNTHVIKMTQEICFMLSTVLIKHNQQAPFGLLAETFARIALVIQPDLDVDFNYLSSQNKIKRK